MTKYPAIIATLAASVCLWTGIGAAARLPEGLPNLLKNHNFNIYPAPCPANNMVLRDLGGGVVDLSALRGKVVILNFWKIDCQPCSVEKPILERLHRKYARRGLVIVAVNLFDDQGRVKSYARRHGFGYRFCCDPENRFTVRKQSLGGGTPSTFIVNSKSEAIYEVPGVPTTYLIDRTGQVIGNGVGMVNWEERPFAALIESLLGPQRQLAAQNNDAFSDVARQGPVTNPTVRQAGPRRMNEKPSSPAEQQIAPSPSASGRAEDFRLPGAGPTETPSASTTASEPTPARKDLRTKQGRSDTREPQRTRTKPNRKTHSVKNSLTPRVTYGKPKPYRPPTQPLSNPDAVMPGSRHLAQAATSPIPPKPYAPPRTAAPTPTPPPGQNVRSALPAAMPYTPPNIPSGQKPSARPVVPDENGNIMARIPSRYSTPTVKEVKSPQQTAPIGSPYARPRMPANPIDSFILDSFESGTPQRQAPPQALYPRSEEGGAGRVDAAAAPYQTRREQSEPASSLLGQLGRDVQNLGAGIKQTFSGFWPGR